MDKKLLLGGLTAALMIGCASTVTLAQRQEGGAERGGSKAEQGEPKGSGGAAEKGGGTADRAAEPSESKEKSGKRAADKEEPKGKSSKATEKEPEHKGKSGDRAADKTEPSEKHGKDSGHAATPADKSSKDKSATDKSGTESKDKSATDKTGTESKDKSAADKTGRKSKDKAAAVKSGTEPKDKSATDKSGTEPKDKSTAGAPDAKDKKSTEATHDRKGGDHVQISEQQRTNIGQTIAKEKSLNRVTNVNVEIRTGSRVPRSVTLVALPPRIVEIVPEYREYRYFVVNDEACIVDPNSYEIVDVIHLSGSQTAHDDHRGGGSGTLVLTEEEQRIIRTSIELRGSARAVFEVGATVPQDIELRGFPEAVVQKVPKVSKYKYCTSENRIAIVDPNSDKVQLVIDERG